MQTVVLIIHLVLALSLMGVVLLQRSEGGGLGIGGSMGPQAGRPPMTGLAKLTWAFAAAFICTSLCGANFLSAYLSRALSPSLSKAPNAIR